MNIDKKCCYNLKKIEQHIDFKDYINNIFSKKEVVNKY
jgi:hypothetical protein